MERKRKSLGVNAALNGFRQLLNFVFPLITFPYTSRVLSVNSMGIYNFSNNYVNYFMLVAALGISTYAVREGARYRDDTLKLGDFASQVFTLNILSTIISYGLLIISLVAFTILRKYMICILVFSLQIIFTTIGTEWIYTIYEDFAYITIRSIVFKIFSILLLFILVRRPSDYFNYATITVLASVGSNVLNYFHAKSFINIRMTKDFVAIKKHLRPVFTIFFSSIAVNIYVSSDTTILGLMKGDHSVGIYGVASKIYSIVAPLLASILVVTVPRLAMFYGKRKFDEYKAVLEYVIRTMTLLVLPSAIGMIMLAPSIITIISGSKYIYASSPLKMLSIALIFSLFNTILSECVLIPARLETKLLHTNIIAALFNLGLNLILIPFFSYNAAAFTTVLSECVSLILNFWYSKKLMTEIVKNKNIIQNLFQVVCGCAAIIVCCLLFDTLNISFILKVVLQVATSILSYGLILLLMRNQALLEIVRKVF
ncbi:flippase [Lactobacillus delbrueckii]|uniref:flippase n=1 Tax=Lactobacillus delbrueckii TaxID=1584 RepID=UPI00272AE2EB|nr:flippase [Lactobacillus delbrueckii]WKZ98215.1 flippase [Lactobacillus delbrueckii]